MPQASPRCERGGQGEPNRAAATGAREYLAPALRQVEFDNRHNSAGAGGSPLAPGHGVHSRGTARTRDRPRRKDPFEILPALGRVRFAIPPDLRDPTLGCAYAFPFREKKVRQWRHVRGTNCQARTVCATNFWIHETANFIPPRAVFF